MNVQLLIKLILKKWNIMQRDYPLTRTDLLQLLEEYENELDKNERYK